MRKRQITTKWVQSVVLISFFLLSMLAFCCAIEASNPDVEEAFEEDEDEDSIQRQYVINVANKAEDCYFIPDVKINHVLNFHFVVTSAGRSGQQLDISTKIRAPSGKLVVYSNRKVEDQLLGYEIQEQGDYEICFNNRYSMLEHKRIFWQFEIEGAFDVAKAEEKLLNATMEFYNEASNQVQKVVRKVRSSIARARHQQWWLSTMGQKHQARLEAVQGMIDRWSLGHIFLLVAVGVVQLVVLRRLFESKPTSTSHKFAARA